jgi:hypothetical protein
MSQDATIQERVQELTWALVDEQINQDEMQLLEGLLLSDDQARSTYIDCIQLHTDLSVHFAKAASGPATPDAQSPVLSFLGGMVPPVDSLPATQ